MTDIESFLREQGLDSTSTDAELFRAQFVAEMKRGVSGQTSSLAMIPTYISCGGAIADKSCAIAVDVGGTNFRTGLVSVDGAEIRLEHFSTIPTPGAHGKVTWGEFISAMADRIRPLLQYTDKIGICISFPTTVTPQRDGIIQRLTKEVNIDGFEGRHICRDLLAELNTPEASALVLNDTTAVLLSGMSTGADSSALVGLILGTGTNICCQIKNSEMGISMPGSMVVDVESGGFVPPQRFEIDTELDSHTIAPGVYLEEKMVSGAYLGELCRIALLRAAKMGLLSRETLAALKALPSLATPVADSFGRGGKIPQIKTALDEAIARQIVSAVFDRAAKHVACSLAAIYDYTNMSGASMTVSADGSVFKKSGLFMAAFKKYIDQYMPGRIGSFVAIEDSTIIGTALAAVICENHETAPGIS